ncbi:MAG: PKD domain-containing protein, partial [Terriglobales bacterium]
MVLALGLASPVVWAQDEEVPKWDIFAGYAWMEPGGNIAGTSLDEMPKGWGATATYNVDKYWGLSLDFGGNYGDNADVGTIMAGPRFSIRSDNKITPYGHALFGLHRLSPIGLGADSGFGIAVGGGLDLSINKRFSWKIIEADYVWAHHNFAPLDRPNLAGARLRTGIVVKFGGEEPIPPSASCTAEPSEVMAGEPVRVTATGANFRKGKPLTYSWTSTGGSAKGQDNVATVDTAGLAPGSYTVTSSVSDGKLSASCSASFSVKEPPRNPPRISCSANPTTVMSGDPSTISCTCNSPDNRSLSYSWNTSSGRLSDSGATAQLDTAGLPASTVTINTTCTDDRGLSDSTSTRVNVTVPPPPPQAEKINECAFVNTARPARVDNACKAALDDVALRLQRDADARAVIVGQADATERRSAKVAMQRADNSKEYLVKEKGIDASRIETRAGT